MTIRVLLADDNSLFRANMASLFARLDDVEVVEQVDSSEVAVREAWLLEPEVVLLDLALPARGAVTATRQILRDRPSRAIALLVDSEEALEEWVRDLVICLRLGARGYLLKSAEPPVLHSAIRTLAQGGAIVSPYLARGLLHAFELSVTRERRTGTHQLTPREWEILHFIGGGMSNQEIADRLVLTPTVITVHLRNVLDKFVSSGDDPPDMLGAGVPRRPPPNDLSARAAAMPDEDPGALGIA